MNTDGHTRLLGVLHIVAGAITLAAIGLVTLFFGVFFTFAEVGAAELGIFASLAAVVALPGVVYCVVQIVCAICLLRGSRGAKTWLIVIGAIGLINVPLGTLLGVYTLWVLLREAPQGSPTPTAGTAGI